MHAGVAHRILVMTIVMLVVLGRKSHLVATICSSYIGISEGCRTGSTAGRAEGVWGIAYHLAGVVRIVISLRLLGP